MSFDFPPGLIQWQPTETLYSLLSRQHRLFGNRLAGHTARMLFGKPRLGYQHDFPSGLSELEDRTQGQWGSAVELAHDRTLLRYYLPFLTFSRERDSVAAMLGNSVAHLKFRLGLLTGRFRANHPLKACAQCLVEDRKSTGWVWWRREHQYPGVWICLRHDEPLRESLSKSNGVERFQWILPDDCGYAPPPWTGLTSHDQIGKSFRSLAELVTGIVESQPLRRLDPVGLRNIYRGALETRGLARGVGRIALSEAAFAFAEHVRPLRLIPELDALPRDVDQARMQLTRLLAPPRSGTHPLRHLTMIDWLIGSAPTLFNALDAHFVRLTPSFPPSPTASTVILGDDRIGQIRELIQVRGMSMRAAAKQLDIDTQTAMVWAARAGLEANRRPKTLKPGAYGELTAALRRGCDKKTAASRWAISVTTVTSVLRTVPGLHQEWTDAVTERRQTRARRDWLNLLDRYALMGVKLMRMEAPATYAWLYRNDRRWLLDHSPSRTRCPQVVRVDWDRRDLELCESVRRAALQVLPTLGRQHLRLWHLIQVQPALKAKLRRLDRLPLTRKALQEAIGKSGVGEIDDQLLLGEM